MQRIFSDIVQTTGNTPLVRLNRVVPNGGATVLVKLEYFNPLSSVKDRVARAMVETAEQAGILTKVTHIVEPTSGNTGIGLAFIAAARGYRLTLVMPDSMSIERRMLFSALGANLLLTPAVEGMSGSIRKANELAENDPNVWIPQQFENPANPAAHEATTGPEIWRDTDGKIDVFVAAVGTGGTFTGTTRFLRRQNPNLVAVAVEPAASPVISGGKPGPHTLQGIGAGFIPKNFDISLMNAIETVTHEEAFKMTRRLAKEEGLLVGISAGTNAVVCARLASKPEYTGKTIVTVAPDGGDRYLSTPLFQN
ncbi:MAG: cysteine synthase A [Thermoguttaceae bacterium]|nr:cysteine synthase A [Thermoguttaceae bacterium]